MTSSEIAAALPAQNVNLGESEALKCEEKIASVRRDVLGKYEDSLGELQATLQKAADLEGSLAVRALRVVELATWTDHWWTSDAGSMVLSAGSAAATPAVAGSAAVLDGSRVIT